MQILCPLDVYGCADAVVDRALWLSRRADDDRVVIDLLVVVDQPESGGEDAIVVGERRFALDVALDVETAALLRGFAIMVHRNGALGTVMVRAGAPVDNILAVCAERGPDMLVMGSHARTGLRRAVFGSVAEEVLRQAKRPVLVVPAGKSLHEHPSDAVIQHEADAAG